jgi:hypothetical protein
MPSQESLLRDGVTRIAVRRKASIVTEVRATVTPGSWSSVRHALLLQRLRLPDRVGQSQQPHPEDTAERNRNEVDAEELAQPKCVRGVAVVRAFGTSHTICWVGGKPCGGRRNFNAAVAVPLDRRPASAARRRSIPLRRRWIYAKSHPNDCVPARPAVSRCVSPTHSARRMTSEIDTARDTSRRNEICRTFLIMLRPSVALSFHG